jgi:PAS domain S-box-containing protein
MASVTLPQLPKGIEQAAPLPTLGRSRRFLAILGVAYAIAALVVVAAMPHNRAWRPLSDWIAAPLQVLAIISCLTVIFERRRAAAKDLPVWWFVFVFCITSLSANYVWNVWRNLGKVPSLSVPDLLYILDYLLLTLAYAVAFAQIGGSFRDRRTWLDAGTIFAALLSTFWVALHATFLPPVHGAKVDVAYAMAYAVSIAVWMVMATLLFLRMPSWRSLTTLLIAAGLVESVWEVGWLATWLTDRNYVGYYYNFGDVICFTLIVCAAAKAGDLESDSPMASVERSSYAFVPTLSALLAIAVLGATLASTRDPNAWILMGLVILTALLIVARQAASRRELQHLHRELAFKEADARLTELVRQSADALLVIDANGFVVFASPSTEAVLGVPPMRAMGRAVSLLFGMDHKQTVEAFLRDLHDDPHRAASFELVLEGADQPARILRCEGANRIDNEHISGLTLTISDISKQRALERDVLTAANHERLRLAGDIHDGLGQELSGIALMLKSVAKPSDIDSVRRQTELNSIIGHLSDAIRNARDLARGLSPIYVVRGSLREALRRLSKEFGAPPVLQIEVAPVLEDQAIDELLADHIYRIAREAVQNSIRHSACSKIVVRLRLVDDSLVLDVVDDGVGYDKRTGAASGFGLQLMEYRARVIGGSFEVSPLGGGGTVVRVSARLWRAAQRQEQAGRTT